MSGDKDVRTDLGIINQSLTIILIKRSEYTMEFSVCTQKTHLFMKYNLYMP